MYGSLDFVRLPLGLAECEAIKAGRRGFAAEASFSRRLLGVRLRSLPVLVPQLTTVGFLAYSPGVHQAAVRAEREGRWFPESWCGRFAVERADGRWRGLDVPALAR